MQTHLFQSKKIEEEDISVKYEFTCVEGERNFGLTRTVFGEFIEYPILERNKIGLSFIAVGNSPLVDKTITYSIELDEANNRVLFSMTTQLLRSKIIDGETPTSGNIMYMKMADGTTFELKNVTDRTFSQVLYIQLLAHMLDGMTIDIDINDYIPRCKNCCFNKENILVYHKLYSQEVRDYINANDGCLINRSQYDLNSETVECDYLIRNTYPNTKSISNTIEAISQFEDV